MKYYFAANTQAEVKKLVIHGVTRILLSYAVSKNPDSWEHFNEIDGCELMVDSGAYSVWNSGKVIDLQEYIDFCLRIKELIKCPIVFVSLDVIPPKADMMPAQSAIDKAALQSIANYEACKAAGFNVLPVYHQGEQREILHEYMKYTDYIGISGDNSLRRQARARWFAAVFSEIRITIKAHGFGHGSRSFMNNFPFYSTDSASFKRIQRGSYRINGEDPVGKWATATDFIFRQSVKKYLTFERHATELWEQRGIVWTGK